MVSRRDQKERNNRGRRLVFIVCPRPGIYSIVQSRTSSVCKPVKADLNLAINLKIII